MTPRGGATGAVATREFLISRRARITPEQAGLPAWGGQRRVPGLRREEAAQLAGVSVDYYTRMERGNLAGVSEQVLSSLADGLQLDEAERAHLFDLARAANRPPSRGRSNRRSAPELRPSVQRVLDAITDAPAYVRNARRDILATNRLGAALYSELYGGSGDRPVNSPVNSPVNGPVNIARFVFLDPRARTFFPQWERVAADSVATLRTEAGQDPLNRELSDLVGELSTRSEDFSRRWAAHDVRFHRSGTKIIVHPVVGELALSFEALELPADPGLALVVYSAEPGTPAADGLRLLASWAATTDLEHEATDHEEREPCAERSSTDPATFGSRTGTTRSSWSPPTP